MKSRKTGEFERIARIFAPLASGWPGAFGLRDDAAVIRPTEGRELVVTTDTVVAGIHYVGDEPPHLIAQKLLRVNLSDLASMGARPRVFTLNAALPESVGDAWLERFAEGLAEDQRRFGIVLAGGDSVSAPGPVTLTVTAIGEVAMGKAVRRDGGSAGDSVFVTGTVGDGALGLKVLRGDVEGLRPTDAAALIERYRLPEPRLEAGQALAEAASAMIDVSDGLVADLGHLATASSAGAAIEAGRMPLSAAARKALDADPALAETVLTGGDDYELLFAAAPENREMIDGISRDLGLPITYIGRLVGEKGVQVKGDDGNRVPLGRAGFTHGIDSS